MKKSSKKLMNPCLFDTYSEFTTKIAFNKCSYASIVMCLLWKVCHLWTFKTTKKWNLPSISLFFCTYSKLLSQNIRWRHIPTCCIQASCTETSIRKENKNKCQEKHEIKSERSEKSCRKILSDGWYHSPSSTVLIVSFTECIPL